MSENNGMKPRLLLVEDDSISRSFMMAALEALPARVDAADSMTGALALESGHDLWLLDVNLPDGSGIQLLAQLQAQSPNTPALAHTADDSPALHGQLLAAGFLGVLVKPLTATMLQDEVHQWLGPVPSGRPRVSEPSCATLPLWDEATALAALNGNHEHVATLRKMFLDELMRQHDAVLAAVQENDHERAHRELHQLKASSGFVGALHLNAAAGRLEKSLADAASAAEFSAAVRDTQSSG